MVDPFAQQHLPGSVRAVEEKLRARRAHDSILYGLELQVENLPQIVLLQAPEDDYVVDPVHELGRKLTSGGFNRRAGNLLINFRGRRICRDLDWSKTDTARNQFRHLAGSQVRRHNHYRAREINAAVIAQGQGCLILSAPGRASYRPVGWEDSCPPGRLDKGRSSVVRLAPDRQCDLTASLQTHWRLCSFDRRRLKPCLSSR